MAAYSNYFINGDTLQNATGVFTDLDMTTLAPNGLYSNGIVSREQSSSGLGPITICPTCSSVLCEHNIAIDPPAPGKVTLDYGMGSSVGAIKVTIYGITTSVVGVGIKQGSNGFFNTFSSTGDSGQTHLAGPDVDALTYFYTDNFKAPCSNWVNGIASPPVSPQLETYSYNPSSGSFIPTGVFNPYSFTNRTASAVLSTTGDMVAYIPSDTSEPTLSVTAVYPCPTQPLISVDCPILLYNVLTSASLNPETSADDACDSDTFSASKLVHGKVRGTVDGEFMEGDYIFTTPDLDSGNYAKKLDGYYKGLRSNFPEATGGGANIYCTFRSTYGIISEVLACQ
mgnify:CR=1 FL=1|tara:strand:- start:193 stop:1212 length:1020 start_codon:yes stop_codon:yes gene_type:complete